MGRRACPPAAAVPVRDTCRQRAPRQPAHELLQHEPRPGLLGEPHGRQGAATRSRRECSISRSSQAQITGGAGGAIGTLSFAHDQAGVQSVRYVLRVCERGDRHLQFVFAGLRVHRIQQRDPEYRPLRPGQLEGQQPPDDGLRCAVSCTRCPTTRSSPHASNFLPDLWDPATGSGALRSRVRQRSLLRARVRTVRRGTRPPASSWARTSSIAIGTIVPELRGSTERPPAAGRGHRRVGYHLADSGDCAAAGCGL